MSRNTSLSGSPADEQVSTRNHQRTPSGQLKKTKTSTAKTLRPLTTRRESSKAHPKTKSKTTPATDAESNNNDGGDDDDIAPTFLQYCATCEQQILAPLSTGLYCSQACKSKDAAETTGYPLFQNDYRIPSSSRRSHPSLSSLGQDVVPQRSPTQPSALFPRHRSIPSASAFTAPSSYESDANMKRDSSSSTLSSLSASPSSRSVDRSNSEASIYLQQFHSFGFSESPRRSSTANGVPSLSHTPSSNKTSSESSSPSPAARPAIRPHTSFSHKGIDLVTPITAQDQAEFDSSGMGSVASDDTIRPEGPNATSKSIPIHSLGQQHLSYEKQAMPRTHVGGSLKKLLETRK